MKTFKNLAYCLWLVVALLGLNACGGTDAVSPISSGSGSKMTAKIDGKNFTPTIHQYDNKTVPSISFIIGNIPNGQNITLSISNQQVGEYDLSRSDFYVTYGAVYATVSTDFNSLSFANSGKITITERTSNKIKGTFNFVVMAGGKSVNVTDGVFDYNF